MIDKWRWDVFSGRIAKALYPTQDIRIENFRDSRLPEIDAVIGNVPFADVKLEHRGRRFSLHDYFFAKSVDSLKPGGVLVLPLSIGPAQFSIAFAKEDGVLRSRSLTPCSFMPLRGSMGDDASGGLTVTIRGTPYPVLLPKLSDPRLHLAAVIITLQVLGQTAFGFSLSIAQILVAIGTCAVLEVCIAFFRQHVVMWPASALLTGNGVAFILRVPGTPHGDWWSLHGAWIFAATAAVSLLSKHLIRWRASPEPCYARGASPPQASSPPWVGGAPLYRSPPGPP